MPTGSHPQEFFEVFRRATKDELHINLSTVARAISLRHRLNKFRRQLREDDHPFVPVADSIEFALEKHPDGTATIIARAVGAEYLDALRNAGVQLGEAPPPPEGDIPELPDDGISETERVLKDLFGKEEANG